MSKSSIKAVSLYLFALRVNPEARAPELFTLFLYGDVERPITRDGQLLFFTKPERGDQALELAGLRERFPQPAPREISCICDLPAALDLISAADTVESSLLDTINALLDMMAATQTVLPKEDHRILHELADYLTFDKELGGFFDGQSLQRDQVRHSMLGLIGALTLRSRVVA